MSKTYHIKYVSLGTNLGPLFNLTANVGVVIPSTVSDIDLLNGINVMVDDTATILTVTSTNIFCPNQNVINLTDCEYGNGGVTGVTTTTTLPSPTIYRPNLCAISNGLLYNYYVVENSRKLTSDDNWVVPSVDQFNTLYSFASNGLNEVGAKLKETGTVHWNLPNIANNYYWFNALGSGWRLWGNFIGILDSLMLWSTTTATSDLNNKAVMQITSSSLQANILTTYGQFKSQGLSIRLVRNNTTLTNRLTGQYVGNDNTVYNTICIGTQEWLATNLNETKYRDGSNIAELNDINMWNGDRVGALCTYGNLWGNSSPCFPPPVVEFPEAFSPNGDGANDYFIVKNVENYPYNKMFIYTRSGQLVYQCLSDYSNHPWNGKLNNTGSLVPTGTYAWVFEMYNSAGSLIQPYKGYIYVGY